MNPDLEHLRPYPFERLRSLLAGAEPPRGLSHVDLSIGEPRHCPPPFVLEALARALPTLGSYPATRGSEALREAIAAWLCRRYRLPGLDPAGQVLPVTGSREALFSFAQAVVDRSRDAAVVLPSPGYQIYEGAAILAGARVHALALDPARAWRMPIEALSPGQWDRVQLLYTCSPGNPTGQVLTLADWAELFALSDRHGFVIASDECYSEIHFDEAAPPLGALEAAHRLGRGDFRRLVVFSSLSKRSNVPGLRSGFVAGDAGVLARYLAYRTYHGCAMNPAVQAASVAAWGDEEHVRENRERYRAKFDAAVPALAPFLPVVRPDAGFYLWFRAPEVDGVADDEAFARSLYEHCNISVLPGTYLCHPSAFALRTSADSSTSNSTGKAGLPAEARGAKAGYIRMALVASEEQVGQATERIRKWRSEA
jgi:N-succinyldiaminopimelate aminotransferase